MLIGFLVGHLLGNLTMYLGPDAFNACAKKLTSLRPGLLVIEFGLLVIFVIHMWYTFTLVAENVKASGSRYEVTQNETRSFATRIMPFTGLTLFLFVVVHLIDFTFAKKDGAASLINGENYYLFGLVYNSFKNPFHSLFYIVAMGCLGFHITHGIKSVFQTFGFHSNKYTPMIYKFSMFAGWGLAFAFAFIPVAVMLDIIKV